MCPRSSASEWQSRALNRRQQRHVSLCVLLTLEVLKRLHVGGPRPVDLAGTAGLAPVGNTWLLGSFTKQNKCCEVSGVCVCLSAEYSLFVVSQNKSSLITILSQRTGVFVFFFTNSLLYMLYWLPGRETAFS